MVEFGNCVSMAAPTNSGESDMATEDFYLNLSPLPSPRWSPQRLTPSPPRPFLPSSNSNYSMVMQYQGSNQSMDDPPQNQEHDDIVDPAPYLARDSASDWRTSGGGIMTMNNQGFEESNMGFEESMEMTTCFYFPPSPTNFPLYRPMPSVFSVSSEPENISLAFSYQHMLEDKTGALHVINWEDIIDLLLFDAFMSYTDNKFDDLEQIAIEAGVVPKVVKSLLGDIEDTEDDEKEVTLRRINWFEQDDVDIVDQPVYEGVAVVDQLIQNRGGELDVILGGGVFTVNGLEQRYGQGSPTTPEPLLILQAKFSCRVWLTHDGHWAAEIRLRCSRLNNGRFTTVEDAISAYEFVIRWSGWKDLTGFAGLFENENRSNMPLQLSLPAKELNPVEDFGLVCCNGTRNDEIESVGTGSEETEDYILADQARLNSGCLGKRKTMEKNTGGERRSKKTNGVRIAIPLEDILQNKGMRLKDAANHLGVSQSSLKDDCREYGIPRWPPSKLITQSHPTETPTLVDQGGIPQSNSDTLPSDQGLAATVEKITNVVVKEILPPPFLPTARQESLNEDFGNFEVEAVGIRSGGTGQSEMEEGQLNSRHLQKEERKEMIPRGEKRNKKTSGVRIAISLEEILQTKEMPLKDAATLLKVSRSTLKRVCREYGIKRWPPRKEHELINQTQPNKFPAVVDQEQTPQLNFDTILPSNQVLAHPNESPTVVDLEKTPQLNSDKVLPSNQVSATIDTKSVKFKARYEGSTITFRLSRPLRKIELEKEVKKRLQLEAGTYNISYKDEDADLVSIACDEDLEECISGSSPLASRCHELFLKPKLLTNLALTNFNLGT